jgi:ATP-dependent helicase HrpB
VLRAERQRKVGELILSREPLTGLDEAARSQALVNLVRRKGLELLPWTPELRQWQARVALLRQLDLAHRPTANGRMSATRVAQKPGALADALSGQSLAAEPFRQSGPVEHRAQPAALAVAAAPDELAPHHISVPSGSSIRLDYSESTADSGGAPAELFGLAETPRIAGGRQVVKLHLLSPARRPVQVTQDLANFWRSTYAEVKKDLKGAIRSIIGRMIRWWPRPRRGSSRASEPFARG